MRSKLIFIVYSFFWISSMAQQYPFVQYTPKDGLISNRIKSIYQDSKGILYFISYNGLSMYDGARFHNYTPGDGLHDEIVNCVMEMGDDSIWVVTNTGKINCLVKGKIKSVTLKDSLTPVVNNLCRTENGSLYAATDQGLYQFSNNRFTPLPLLDLKGKNVGSYIAITFAAGRYLLVQRENTLLRTEDKYKLYLYDTVSKKITGQSKYEKIYSVSMAPDGRIWAGTDKNILSINTTELKKGHIIFNELPPLYDKIKNTGRSYLFFQADESCWTLDKSTGLKRITSDGSLTLFTASSGLVTTDINYVFRDKEGIIWLATNSSGVQKLVHTNISFNDKPFGLSGINDLSYSSIKNQILLYSFSNATALTVTKENKVQKHRVANADRVGELVETPKNMYGLWLNHIYLMVPSGNTLHPEIILSDTSENQFNGTLVDNNGNLIVCGTGFITVIVNGKIIHRKKINYMADHAAIDAKGNIWVATRAGEIIMYRVHPEDPANYLEKKFSFSKELSGQSPRSITIDKNGNIWVGMRQHGLFAFSVSEGVLKKKFVLNTSSGLSDNFITDLVCDVNNDIWACTPSGLDKISLRNDIPVIENLTKQNNIYQSIRKLIFDHNDLAWVLVPNGVINIAQENLNTGNYKPVLMISSIKAGKDILPEKDGANLAYKQNNLSFYVAATSFLDEKHVLYSYLLEGSGNGEWTDPSNNASVSFNNLRPGDYTLNVKASFPAGIYHEQSIKYHFSITPPWWQTWWFRAGIGFLGISIVFYGFRFYHHKKLNKEKRILEKQHAIELERTRIATDMHDDLGAGLSRIRFLSQALMNKNPDEQSVKSGLEKITGYSDEMTEKMGEIVWALNEKNDTLADLVAYTRSYTVEYLANHNITCKVDTPLQLPGTFIAGEIRRNIFLSVKECLHNIIKHANASAVKFSIQLNGNIEIIIHDNGRGIDWSNQRAYGNGLLNIQKRMKELHGSAEFSTEQGTRVLLKIPLNI